MEWRRHRETAPGQYPAASAAGGFCSPALALLPPQRASTGLHAARATPAPRGEPLTTRHRKGLHRERDPLPCAASPFVALVARAAGSQCASSNNWSRHDQTLRHPGTLCCLARVGDRLTTRLPTTRLLPSRTTSPLRVVSCGLFSWLFFSSSSTFLAPRSAASSFSYRINVPFSTTLAPPIRISSSTCSLRIAWEVRLGAVAQAVITMAASVWLTSSTEQSGRSGNNVKMDMDSFLERKFEMSRGEWFLSFYHIFLYER